MPWDSSDIDTRCLFFIGAVSEATGTLGSEHPASTVAAEDLRRAWTLLNIRDGAARLRLQKAITDAIEQAKPSVLIIGSLEEGRTAITVRPAREAGWAAISSEPLNGGAAQLDWQRLREVFDLSRSEAEVALGLLRGVSLIDIAHQRGVQHETVRGQVKTLLRKVGVASQKQLTAVLTQVGALLGGAMPRRI